MGSPRPNKFPATVFSKQKQFITFQAVPEDIEYLKAPERATIEVSATHQPVVTLHGEIVSRVGSFFTFKTASNLDHLTVGEKCVCDVTPIPAAGGDPVGGAADESKS